MDNVIVKYSEFFQNDGGFEQIKSDFKDLGEFLIKEAKRVKSEANLVDLQNISKLAEYEERTDSLAQSFQEYGKAKENITKIETEYLQTQKKITKAELNTTKALDKLNIELKQHQIALASVNRLEKEGKLSIEEATVARGKAKLLIKGITQEINKQEKELIDLTKLTKQEIKLLEAKAVLQKGEATNINEIRERLSALRIVAAQVNITTQEGKDQVAAYNSEIDELTDTLSANSDKFIQNKINVGNYEESIISALEQTQFFKGELSFLNGVTEKVIGSFKRSTKATEKDTEAKKSNATATISLGKSIKILNNVAKASVILLLVAAIASLAAVFNQGRAGAIATGQAMARFTVFAKVAITTLAEVGKGLFSLFSAIFTSFKNGFRNIKLFFLELKEGFAGFKESIPEFNLFGDKKKSKTELEEIRKRKEDLKNLREEIAKLKKEQTDASKESNYADAWKKITTAISGAKDAYKNGIAAIDTLDDAAIKAFQLADAIKEIEISMISLRTKVNLLEQDSQDSTLSLLRQQEALKQLQVEKLKLLGKEQSIALKNLQIANAKAKADAQANGIEIGGRNAGEFAQNLLNKNIALDETKGQNPLDDAALNEVIDAYKTYLETIEAVKLAQDDFADQARNLAIQNFDTNITMFLKTFESQKDISEDFINDSTQNFKDILIEFDRLRSSVIKNASDEINEFNKLAGPLESNFKFDIKFDDNGGFKIFNNNVEIATDDIQKMTEQLNQANLPTSIIERFGKLVDKTRDQVLSTKVLGKEITLTSIKLKELFANLEVDKTENDKLKDLNERIKNLRAQTPDFLDNQSRKKILKDLEQLEKEKTEIESNAEAERNQNRINAIDEELKLVKSGSEKETELLRERKALEKEIIDNALEKNATATKEQNEKAIAEYQKFIEELKNVFEEILDKISEVSEKRVQTAEKEVDKQNELVDEQKRRAELGLTNTLAFEQKQMAEREAELIKQRKRQERLEKIKALWTSYNAYAEKEENPNQAIFKALRDFAILDAIAATFGDGGLVSDKIPVDSWGITRGRSHNGRGGGIPVLVEGGEGFFSAREVNNMGRDNFYRIKQQASLGPLDTNMFSGQKETLLKTQPIFVNNDKKIINELRGVKSAIESKTEQTLAVPEVVDGILRFTETIKSKNKKTRNHYVIPKPRL